MQNEKGFTKVELMISIAFIVILTAITTTLFSEYKSNSTNVHNMTNVLNTHLDDNKNE